MLFPLCAKSDDIESTHSDCGGDGEDLIVFDRRDMFIGSGDGVETSEQSQAFRWPAHVSKRTRDEVIIAGAMSGRRFDGRLGKQRSSVGIDLGEDLESLGHGVAFGVVGPQVRSRDAREQVGEGGDEARLLGGEAIELSTNLGEAGGLAGSPLRLSADSQETQ